MARRRVEREPLWSALIIVILAAGATASISATSIGFSLQSGLRTYADATATYIVVQNNNNPEYGNQRIPESVIQQINQTQGVEVVYPVATAYTYFFFPNNVIRGYSTVGNQTYPIVGGDEGLLSAVFGGGTGFPQQLLTLESGVIPGGSSAGFILNGVNEAPENYSFAQIAGVNFNATQVGVNSFTPLIGNNLPILWNANFVKGELGAELFNSTFGEEAGTSFLIVKASSINQVSAIAAIVTKLLSPYPQYNVQYDQSTINNLSSLESGAMPTYILLGGISLGTTALAFASVAYIAAKRRRWETALLRVQGWKWRDVSAYLSWYFIILAAISFTLALLATVAVLKYSSETFQVYGGFVSVPASFDLASALVTGSVLVLLAVLFPIAVTASLRRNMLDATLREY